MHTTAELLQRQLYAYSDAWRFESERDVPPWELEGVLEAGVSIFRLIRRLDEHLRLHADAAELTGREIDLRALYTGWLHGAAGPLGRLNHLEGEGYFVTDARDFRDAVREAHGVLRLPLEAVLGQGMRDDSGRPTIAPIGDGPRYVFPA